MLRRNMLIVSLIILVLLSTSRSASAQPANQPAQSDEVVTATNGIYDIFVNSTSPDIGTYTIRTGVNHPVTLALGSPQSVLYGGDSGSPGTSFNTIRSYVSNTDYVQDSYTTSSFTVVNLDAYSAGTVPLGNTGYRTTWILPGPPATPDKLSITQDIEITGTTFLDSTVMVNVQVTNPNFSPVDLGVRYLWDFEIGYDDGPVFTQHYPDGSPLTREIEFRTPGFGSYHIQDNDNNPNSPTFSVYGSAMPPSGLDFPSGPDVLQFTNWSTAFSTAFDYTVNPNEEISGIGGDSAVTYIFGSDSTTALNVGSNETLTLVAYIGAVPIDSDEDGFFDIWETNDTDLNGDGVIDIGPSVGADPNRKDIYVEVDWMENSDHSHKPIDEAVEKIVNAFEIHNINLHVDAGPDSIDYVTGNLWSQYSKGNAIAHDDLLDSDNWELLRDVNFGHSDRVYRHALFAHEALGGFLGYAEIQYFFVALGTKKNGVGTLNEQAGVFMHELGHTLNLWHGGNEDQKDDEFNYKPNYLSVMNYNFVTSGLIINGTDGHFDYSNFDLPDLTEIDLLELDGLSDERVSEYSTKYNVSFPWFCISADPEFSPAGSLFVISEDKPIDWNCDGGIDTGNVHDDINGMGGADQTLTSWDDWANLDFTMGNIGKVGVVNPIPITNFHDELTEEEDLQIQRISDPRVQLNLVTDVSSVQAGGVVSYTITMFNIDGQDANDVVITETIPTGFNYVPDSTSGATTTDPVIDGQNLSWSPFVVPANGGVLTLSFQATASQIPGIYSDTMSGSSSNGYVVSTGDTAQVEVIPSSNFPSTSVLDNFNRANGTIGSNWSGYTSKYHVTSNQMTVDYNGSNSYVYWKNVSFGADQEAYVTFTHIDSTASEQDLLLKSQSKTTWGDGVIEVLYDPMGYTAQIWTYEWPTGWVQHGADIPVTFVDGDTFGARARANGIVEVYKNGTLLATRDITSWSHYAGGGYIGLWFIGAEDAILDDFGGGTISGGTTPMSMLGGSMESETLTLAQLSVNVQDAVIYWQGIPLGSNQPADVTFANVPANKQSLLLKPQSNGVWGEDVVEVLYDLAGQRIQVWVYDAQAGNGWVQYGKDIPVKFAAGDIFSVQVSADGTVEIYRNERLLAKRDVTP